jgi:hypothetical protein
MPHCPLMHTGFPLIGHEAAQKPPLAFTARIWFWTVTILAR